MGRLVLHISGMHCEACVRRVRQALAEVRGVTDITVTLNPPRATLEAASTVTREELAAAVAEAGYEAVGTDADDDEQARPDDGVPHGPAAEFHPEGTNVAPSPPGVDQPHPAAGVAQTVRFRVSGMHCANCALTIEKALAGAPGVARASVNFATESGSASYDPAQTDREALFRVVAGAGYKALALEEADEASARRELRWLIFCVAALVPTMVLMWLPLRPHRLHMALMASLAAAVQFSAGWTFYRGAWRSLRARAANMDVLVAMGLTAAFVYSVLAALGVFGPRTPTFFETPVMLVTFIRVGKYLEARMRGRASAALRALLDLRPQRAARLAADGTERRVPIDEIAAGDRLVVRPGERVPTDGTVLDGTSLVDESLATGESTPVAKFRGDEVIGGTINRTGLLTIRATRVGAETFLGQIVRMVEEAQADRPPMQRLADRISNVFVPVVAGVAVATFLVWWGAGGGSPEVGPLAWALRMATAVLVIACPCALGLATPTAIVVSSGLALRKGILVKRATALEMAGRLDLVVFDKTGTLTEGRFGVTDVLAAEGVEEREVVAVAAACERGSTHPIAEAIVRHAEEQGLGRAGAPVATDFEEVAGRGARARIDGEAVAVGSERLVPAWSTVPLAGRAAALAKAGRTVVHVARGERYLGLIALADRPRPEARVAVERLRRMGVESALLTGDNRRAAEAVAREVGIAAVEAEVLPAEKRGRVEAWRRGLQPLARPAGPSQSALSGHITAGNRPGRRLVGMVGDGINDAPALAASDVGFAIGSGTDVAKETGDIVLVANDPRDVALAVGLGRRTRRIIKQNFFWAFAYNVTAIPLAAGALYPALGLFLHPEVAGLAMALSSVTVVGNSLRLRRTSLNNEWRVTSVE